MALFNDVYCVICDRLTAKQEKENVISISVPVGIYIEK